MYDFPEPTLFSSEWWINFGHLMHSEACDHDEDCADPTFEPQPSLAWLFANEAYYASREARRA